MYTFAVVYELSHLRPCSPVCGNYLPNGAKRLFFAREISPPASANLLSLHQTKATKRNTNMNGVISNYKRSHPTFFYLPNTPSKFNLLE